LPLSSSNQANNVSSIGNLVSRTNDTSQRSLFRTSGTNPNTAAYAAAKEKERQRILADNERLREQFNRRMAELERSTSEFDAYNEAALASIRKKLNTNYNDLYGRNR
jgi:E3 ubiquitin-protein ligase DOA10